MCINPIPIKPLISVGCRKCWQCRENRINDWVGRCIAETTTAAASHSITLTYGRDDEGREDHARAAVLTYSDVQKYLKRLRTAGYHLRYFAVGEYGSMKGRAHWHLILFWQDHVPDHVLNERFDEAHWPHGYSFWEKPSAASVRYVCKYIQKDIGAAERQGHLAMSKKPPLGAQYFDLLARRYAENGLAPQVPFYSIPGVERGGKPLRFYMAGATRRLFCAAFIRHWAELRGGHPPVSELIESHEDAVIKLDVPFRLDHNWLYHHADEAHRRGDKQWRSERETVETTPQADYRAVRGR